MKVSNLGLHVNSQITTSKIAKIHPKVDENSLENDVTFKQLCNKFVIGQIVTSMISSFIIPFAFYSIVFLPFSTSVILLSPQPLSLFILSPWLCSFMSPLSLPICWPEALKKKYVHIFPDNYFVKSEKRLLFLRHDRIYRFGIVRNLIIGTYLAIFWVPIGIIFCVFCGPIINIISFISFASLYICLISGCTIPLSIISYSVFSNNNRVMTYMKSYPSYLKTISSRMFYSTIC
tara:strand:- start:175 stop:873 length:699 start_codon:yes stop_codon:yes gene_type:complete